MKRQIIPGVYTIFFIFECPAKRSPTMPAKPITPSLGKNPGGAFWRYS